MNKKLLLSSALALMTCLSSCEGAVYNTNLYLGSVTLSYKINEVLEIGSKLTGNITATVGSTLNDSYILAYSNIAPASVYSETVLFEARKSQIESTKNGSNFVGVNFDLTLDLEKVFPKDSESKKVYFVIHGNEWDSKNVLTYNYSQFSFSWNGDKVKLSNN